MRFDIFRIGLILTLILLSVSAVAIADGNDNDKEPVETEEIREIEDMSGKDLFKGFCKSCHMEDSDAGEYAPMFLIVEQWDEFFDGIYQETHKDLVSPKDEKTKVIDTIDKDMLKKIKKFCVDHAADSEQPMTCG